MATNNKSQNNTPVKKFSTGAISAAIFRNEGTGKNGEPVEFSSVTLQRRYLDKADDKWKTSGSLRVNDLPRAVICLQHAFEHIVLKGAESAEAAEGPTMEEEII